MADTPSSARPDAPLRLVLRQAAIPIGSDVVVEIAVANRGDAPLSVPNPGYATSPQPVYTLTLPDGSERRFAGKRADAGDAPTSVEIPPQAEWLGEITLNRLTALRGPGRYTLQATLDAAGHSFRSAPVAFVIEPAGYRALTLNRAEADDGSGGESLSLLRSGSAGPELWAAPLHEEDPTLGEMHRPTPYRLRPEPLPADVVAPLALRHDSDPLVAALDWTALAGPDALYWATAPDAPLQRLPWGATPRLPPVAAVLNQRRLLAATVVDGADGARLLLARIDGTDAASASGTATASTPAPVPAPALIELHRYSRPPQALALATGRVDAGSPLILAGLGALPEQTLLTVFHVAPDGRLLRRNADALRGLQPVGDLAVQRRADGRIEILALLREEHPDDADDVAVAADRGGHADATAAARGERYQRVHWTLNAALDVEQRRLGLPFRLPANAATRQPTQLLDVQHALRPRHPHDAAEPDGQRPSLAVTVIRHDASATPLLLEGEAAPRPALIRVPAARRYVLARGRHVWYAVFLDGERIEAHQL